MIGRDRHISVGSMRYRVTIQRLVTTDGASNQGQPVATWENRFVDEPANYELTSGGQGSRGRQVEETVRAVFTVRHRPGYSIEDRITFDGVAFGVVHIKPVMGRDRFLELHCRSIES